MTRWGPAKVLGLQSQMGHLKPGGNADVVVYRSTLDPSKMFAEPEMVFRYGKLIYRDGQFLADQFAKQHHEAKPDYDKMIVRPLSRVWDDYYTVSMDALCTSME